MTESAPIVAAELERAGALKAVEAAAPPPRPQREAAKVHEAFSRRPLGSGCTATFSFRETVEAEAAEATASAKSFEAEQRKLW